MKKKILIVVAVVVLFGMIIYANIAKNKGASLKVEVKTVRKGDVKEVVRADGEIRALNQVEIGADVSGRIIKIPVKEGDWVKKGDTLCVIDQRLYLTQVKQEKARLASDYARFLTARNQFERTKKLFEDSLVSKAEYEKAYSDYQAMLAQLKADSLSLAAARDKLDKTVITSPVSGQVLAVNKEVGEMAIVGTINTPGSVIMVVADRSSMLVRAQVDETEIVKIKPGQVARIEVDAFPDTSFMGHVDRIAGAPQSTSQASTQGVSYIVDIFFDNPPKNLLPGMSATCDITVASAHDVPIVPIQALGRRNGRNILFVIKNGVAHQQEVKLGVMGERMVEVVSGVRPGEKIAVGPFEVLRKLKDGDKVEVQEKKAAKRPRRPGGRKPERKPNEANKID